MPRYEDAEVPPAICDVCGDDQPPNYPRHNECQVAYTKARKKFYGRVYAKTGRPDAEDKQWIHERALDEASKLVGADTGWIVTDGLD